MLINLAKLTNGKTNSQDLITCRKMLASEGPRPSISIYSAGIMATLVKAPSAIEKKHVSLFDIYSTAMPKELTGRVAEP